MSILDGHIVSHLEDPPGSGLAACNGEPIQEYPEFMQQKMGFVFCEGCRIRALLHHRE